jgi:hypothetical protein
MAQPRFDEYFMSPLHGIWKKRRGDQDRKLVSHLSGL